MSKNRIDVVLLTKNSLSRNLPGVFKRCLNSIKMNIPVNRLILVDGYSNDGTLELVRDIFGNRCLAVRTDALRGKAREIGIKHVTTDLFAFVDDDVVLCKDWFAKMVRYFKDPKVGLVWSRPIGKNSSNWKVMLRLPVLTLTCFMGSTLLKTGAVRGIKIPLDMHVQEDWFISEYVRKRGYYTLLAKNVYAIHIRPKQGLSKKDLQWSAYVQAKYNSPWGKWTWLHMWRSIFTSIPIAMLIWATTGKASDARDFFSTYYWKLIYYIKYKLS